MRVLVTGGAGYIGSAVVRLLALSDQVDEVVAYDNLSRGNYNLLLQNDAGRLRKVRLVRGDLLDSRRLRQVLPDVDTVLHLAARVTTPYSDHGAHEFEQVNHWGTAELVAALEDTGVARLVMASSAAVYGYSDVLVNADTPPSPKTYYGESKLRAERQCERLADRCSLAIVRAANVYGLSEGMRFDAVINRFMISAHLGEAMAVQGSGEQVRSFVHVDTAARSFARLVEPNAGEGLFDLVEHTRTINAVTEDIRVIYPRAECLYIAQHIAPRHLKVGSQLALNHVYGFDVLPMQDRLRHFADGLAIPPVG
jgi:UDP-glucose 4-epimerase